MQLSFAGKSGKTMNKSSETRESANNSANRVKHASTCITSPAWPPAWLNDATPALHVPAPLDEPRDFGTVEDWREMNADIEQGILDGIPPEEPAATLPVSGKCRCGSARTVDALIHRGQSTRRDCARCGRFISFTRWYGVEKHD